MGFLDIFKTRKGEDSQEENGSHIQTANFSGQSVNDSLGHIADESDERVEQKRNEEFIKVNGCSIEVYNLLVDCMNISGKYSSEEKCIALVIEHGRKNCSDELEHVRNVIESVISTEPALRQELKESYDQSYKKDGYKWSRALQMLHETLTKLKVAEEMLSYTISSLENNGKTRENVI